MAVPSWGERLEAAAARLHAAGIAEAELDALLIAAHVLGLSRTSMLLARRDPAVGEAAARFERLAARRATRLPLAYVLGRQAFAGLTLCVRRGVLVPRWDTEPLVERFLAALAEHRPWRLVADIGCGSGAGAVAIAAGDRWSSVLAVDRAPAAIACTADNAARHGVAHRVRVLDGDLCEPLLARRLDGRLHGIFANLPYIPGARIESLEPEVASYEPRLALDGGPDGMDLYRRLAPQAARLLRHGGVLVTECDPEQAEPLGRILSAAGEWTCYQTIPDLAGRTRGLLLCRGGS